MSDVIKLATAKAEGLPVGHNKEEVALFVERMEHLIEQVKRGDIDTLALVATHADQAVDYSDGRDGTTLVGTYAFNSSKNECMRLLGSVEVLKLDVIKDRFQEFLTESDPEDGE